MSGPSTLVLCAALLFGAGCADKVLTKDIGGIKCVVVENSVSHHIRHIACPVSQP